MITAIVLASALQTQECNWVAAPSPVRVAVVKPKPVVKSLSKLPKKHKVRKIHKFAKVPITGEWVCRTLSPVQQALAAPMPAPAPYARSWYSYGSPHGSGGHGPREDTPITYLYPQEQIRTVPEPSSFILVGLALLLMRFKCCVMLARVRRIVNQIKSVGMRMRVKLL